MFTLADAVVFFRGDDSQLQKDTDKAQTKLGGFVGTAGKLLGGALVGGALAAGAAVAGIGAAAFDVSTQTQQATANIAAQLGVLPTEAEKFGEVARRVYGSNLAESVTEAGDAVAEVAKQLGLAAEDPALLTITQNAFKLKDAFGVEVNESISAVKSLMENFGLSSTEAFDMITAGYQKGLDRSGDFLDTINEYSTQFANGGASASQFFSLLETGMQGGALGTDKAADAFKEFRLRIQDGSETTKAGLEQLGLSAEEISAKLASGQMTVAEAFALVTEKLKETEDPTLRMQAGAALLGTQYEDLGDAAVAALDMTREWAAGSEGAINTLDAKYSTFGEATEAIWRRLVTAVAPFTDKLLDLVNNAMPTVMGAFDTFEQNVVPAIETVSGAVDTAVQWIKSLFQNDLATGIDGAAGKFDFVRQKVDEIMPYVQTIIETVLGAISGFWTTHGDTVTGVVRNGFDTISTIITTTLSVILEAVQLALQLLTGDWEGAADSLKTIAETLWNGIAEIFRLQLNSIGRIVFDFDLGDAGGELIDSLKRGISNKWDDLKEWWKGKLQSLRNMLPFSEPKDPASPLRNLDKAGEGIIEQVQKGLDRHGFSGDFLRPAAAAFGGGGPMAVTLNFYGPADPAQVQRAAEQGLRSVFRQRGMG